MKLSPSRVATLVVLLLAVLALEVTSTIRQQSLTWDEGDHIFAGYMTWKTADFGLNPEHPPLVKLMGTAPLLGLPLHVPKLQGRFFKNESYFDGRDLLFGNTPAYSADALTFRVRIATLPLVLLLALLVFFATQEMFGTPPALIALTLLVFEPNIIAHGAYVTTDTAISCFFFASVYAFYRYCKSPSTPRLVITGLAAGLALASKHSAVILLPVLILLALGELIYRTKLSPFAGSKAPRQALRLIGALAGLSVIAIIVLWAFYGFRYAARPTGLSLDPTLANYTLPLRPLEARGILLFARLHLLPESYLYGLADVRSMANGMPSYIFGKDYEHGVWFYFPSVIAIKLTLGLITLGLLALAAIFAGRLRGHTRELLFLTMPPAFYFLIAMGSSLNIGSRHVLPTYVFLCVLAAAGAWAWIKPSPNKPISKPWTSIVTLLLLFHIASSARAYPNYIAYSNEVWGGPTQTYRYLTDSNTDWGQQLKAVKLYTDQHHIHDCWFAYFVTPFILPSDYGIPCKVLPTPDSIFTSYQYPVPPTITGPVFISAGTLTGFELGSNILNPYRAFRSVTPNDHIQDGVLVYNGTFPVPLASALSHIQRSADLLKTKDYTGALSEAQQSVTIAPQELQPQIALGDALAALGRTTEARTAYAQARKVVLTMEPQAQTVWNDTLNKKVAALP
ncbi:glycosyltransferase family 39 protein [Granulicella arctica]|uniref:4-amino-4-deoxy-L-arabinose transferase-like glycosyltransferase n=1 Tax=Granulicella arctica TaxID=940613 RepID=A0A7Y9TI19_9BACT|nr:glycosyltransferase family 39 protein [Granulicella arctica]NYF80530.1 4-amino-4-deoxy-L-arabinose transferase-like glycosyltransferase [Granulicella arctica]